MDVPGLIYHAVDPDFSSKPGSKALDARIKLPGINYDYSGKAPD